MIEDGTAHQLTRERGPGDKVPAEDGNLRSGFSC